MAEEGFESHYHHHLPQQSRRDKLRLSVSSSSLLTTPHHSSPALLPLYDPSLLLTNFPNHNNNNYNMDPQSSLHEDVNNNSNPFFFPPQNLRVLDQSFNGGEGALVCKPEPLSLSLFSNDLSTRWGPLGPFMGYSLILKSSRFLKPAQQLLEEICDVGRGIYGENFTAETGLMEPPEGDSGGGDESVGEERRMKSGLISMLDEVYKRYKYYYQQVQAVVASFESVSGLSNAAPYANLALKAMARQFRSLKNAITDQLQFTSKSQNHRKDESPRFGNSDSLYSQRPVHNSGFLEHQPVWRSQRGLPERAVSVLKSWLFEHFLHPYPTDTDKLMLAKQTGLSRSQVSNWFINARVRLWKPMVEEVHMLETRQAQNASQREEQNADRPISHLPSGTSLSSENLSTSSKRTRDLPSKRTRNEFPNTSMGTEEAMSLSYENVSAVCGGRGVSLTLGLHQNNGIGLSEAFPIATARRFGLDSSSEGYVTGSLEVQNRQFGRDVIGGQLLHDFVG